MLAILIRLGKKGILFAPILFLLGQTNTTATAAPPPSFDMTPMMNIIYAVIPIILVIYVLKTVFKSFKDLG